MLDRGPKSDLGYIVWDKHNIGWIEGMASWLRGLAGSEVCLAEPRGLPGWLLGPKLLLVKLKAWLAGLEAWLSG